MDALAVISVCYYERMDAKDVAKNLNKLIGRIDYDNKLQKELVTK